MRHTRDLQKDHYIFDSCTLELIENQQCFIVCIIHLLRVYSCFSHQGKHQLDGAHGSTLALFRSRSAGCIQARHHLTKRPSDCSSRNQQAETGHNNTCLVLAHLIHDVLNDDHLQPLHCHYASREVSTILEQLSECLGHSPGTLRCVVHQLCDLPTSFQRWQSERLYLFNGRSDGHSHVLH